MSQPLTTHSLAPISLRRSRGVAAGALAAGLLLALSSGCGGGGGLGLVVLTVGGTAAFGGPVPNAAVLLVDVDGKTASTTTDSAGHYEVSVEGLTPPFLLEVTPTSSPAFYTVAKGPGTANADPYSNLLLESLYQILSTTPSAQLGLLTGGTPSSSVGIPDAVEIAALQDLFERMLASSLQKDGVDPEKWMLLETPFAADGQGYDKLLDQTSVSGTIAGTVVTIQDGTATQTSSVTASSTGVVTVDTMVTTAQGTTQSHDSELIAGSAATQAAIDQVNASLQQAQSTVNQRSTTLTDSDLQPFVHSGYLGEGFNQTQQAGRIADFFRGIPVEWHLTRVTAFDNTSAPTEVTGDLLVTGTVPGGGVFRFSVPDMVFKLDTGLNRYLLFGDRRLAGVTVQTVRETRIQSAGTTTTTSLEAVVQAPKTRAVTAATIQGGLFSAATPTSLTGPTSTQEVYDAVPGGPTTVVDMDRYEATVPVVGAAPSPTTTYSVTVTTSGSTTTTYDLLAQRVEGETITGFAVTNSSSNSVGHTVSTTIGETLTMSWSLPQGYDLDQTIVRVELRDGFGADQTLDVTPEPLASTALSVKTIGAVPQTMFNNNPVKAIEIRVELVGRGQQTSRVVYLIDQ